MKKQKTTQYSIPLRNEPGTLFRLAQTLSKEDINITGIMMQTQGELAITRFLSDKEPQAVRKPLEHAGYQVFENQVTLVELSNETGELSRLCKTLADQEFNIVTMYGTTGGDTSKIAVVVEQAEHTPQFASFTETKNKVTAN